MVNRGVDNGILGFDALAGIYGADGILHLCERNGVLFLGFFADDLPGPAVTAGQWYHAVFQLAQVGTRFHY